MLPPNKVLTGWTCQSLRRSRIFSSSAFQMFSAL